MEATEPAATEEPIEPVAAEALTEPEADAEATEHKPVEAAVEPEAALAATEPAVAEAPIEPDAPVEPRTAGRVIAEALRAAGVTIAFTVPGESFLGLLDGLTAAGIRIVATRHEGGAAFMAEAHGQLTGRPAACLATRAVGAANLAIGIHTARAEFDPDVRADR